MSSYYEDPHQNPYWQNLNGNSSNNGNGSWDDLNRQNTRNTDPNWHPEPEYGRQLGKTAAILGVFSIVTCFFLPLFVPLMFGSVAIVLAVISKGRGNRLTRSAQHAVTLGTIGISINLALIITIMVTFYQMIHNPDMRAQANQIMEQMYGMSFDDMLEQVEAQTGVNLEDGTVTLPSGEDGTDTSPEEDRSPSYEPAPETPDEDQNITEENNFAGTGNEIIICREEVQA